MSHVASLAVDATGYLLICALFALAGSGILRGLRVPLDRDATLLLGPALTQACWGCAAGLLVILGCPLRFGAGPVWAVTLALAAYGLFALRRDAGPEPGAGAGWTPALLLGLSVLLPLVGMMPYLGAGLTDYRGSGLSDGWSYIAAGQYLWQFPRGAEGGLAPLYQYGSTFSYMRNTASSELALLTPAVLPAQAHSTAGLFQALTLFAMLASCAAFIRARGAAWATAALYLVCVGASGWIVNLVWANNYDHALALVYAPALAALCIASARPTAGVGIAIGLILAGLTYTYPEMAVFIVGSAVLIAADRIWRAREAGWVRLAGCAVLVWLLIASPAFHDLYWFFVNQFQNAAQAGARPGEGMFTGLIDARQLPAAFWALGAEQNITRALLAQTLVGALLALLLAVGLARFIQRREIGMLSALVLLLAGAGMFIVFRSYGYGAYKLMLTAWWLIALALIVGWEWLASSRRTRIWAWAALVTCLALPGSVFARDVLVWKQGPPPATAYFGAVQDLDRFVDGQPVALVLDDANASYWAVYFLRHMTTRIGKFEGYLAAPHIRRALERSEPVPWQNIRYVLTDTASRGSINGHDGWSVVWRGGPYTLWDTAGAGWAVVTDMHHGAEDAFAQATQRLDDRPTRLTILANRPGQVSLRGTYTVSAGPEAATTPVRLFVATRGSTSTREIAPGPQELILPVVAGENVWTLITADAIASSARGESGSASARALALDVAAPRLRWAPASAGALPETQPSAPTPATTAAMTRYAPLPWCVPNLRAMAVDLVRYLAVCLVLTLAGRTILQLLPATTDGVLRWLLAPIVGHAFWAFELGVLVLVSVPVQRIATTLWIATAAFAAAGARIWWVTDLSCGRPGSMRTWARQSGVWVAVSLMLPFVVLFPNLLFGFADYPGSRLPDGWAYVAYGQYLWELPRGVAGGAIPLYQYGKALSHTRYLASSELGVLSLLTSPGDVQTVASLLQAVALFCLASACLAFGRTRLLRPRALLTYGVLVVVSGWSVDVVWASNYDNLLALAYFPASAALAWASDAFTIRGAALAGFLASALVYTYPELAPIVLGCAAVLYAERAWRRRERTWLLASAMIAVVFVILSAPYLIEFSAFLHKQVQVGMSADVSGVGGGMFPGLVVDGYRLPAFWGLGAEHQITHALGLQRIAAVCLLLLCAAGVVALVLARELGLLGIMGVMAIGVYMFGIHFAYAYPTYKLLLLFWWIIAFAMLSGARWLSSLRLRWHTALLAASSVMLAASPVAASIRVAAGIRGPRLSIARFQSLEEIKALIPQEPLALFVDDGEASQWAMYYLRGHPVQFGKYVGYPAALLGTHQQQLWPWRRFRFVLTDAVDQGPLIEREGWTCVWRSGAFGLWDTGAQGWAVSATVQNPNGFDVTPAPFLWLGGGTTQINLLASRSGVLSIGAQFVSGPSGSPTVHTRHVRLTSSAGLETTVDVEPGAGSIALPVGEGETVWTLTPTDPVVVPVQPNGDVRPLLIGMSSPTVSWNAERASTTDTSEGNWKRP
jgi:hypothetical protein